MAMVKGFRYFHSVLSPYQTKCFTIIQWTSIDSTAIHICDSSQGLAFIFNSHRSIHFGVPIAKATNIHAFAFCSKDNTIHNIFEVFICSWKFPNNLFEQIGTCSQTELTHYLLWRESYFWSDRTFSIMARDSL